MTAENAKPLARTRQASFSTGGNPSFHRTEPGNYSHSRLLNFNEGDWSINWCDEPITVSLKLYAMPNICFGYAKVVKIPSRKIWVRDTVISAGIR